MLGNYQPDADPLSCQVKVLADFVSSVLDAEPVLAAVRGSAIAGAGTQLSHAETAARLGVSVSVSAVKNAPAVHNAVVAHRASRSARGGESMDVEEGFVGG